uniref:Uncharacterized protein n=1 Tax=Anopheles atroparvus TaxID=41427 RepID=A0AAG5DUA7_ANOAO
MDFFKGVLPPLPKLPNLKKIRNWNGGSLLTLNHLPSLPSTFGLGSFMHSAAPSPPSTHAPCSYPSIPASNSVLGTRNKEEGQRNRNAPHAHFRAQHRRNTSDICIISTAVSSESPAEFIRRDNFGLYALKCDRSAAKHGILLNLPRKLTQAVVGDGSAAPISGTADQHNGVDGALVHEKFSPCKRLAPAPAFAAGILQQQHESVSIKPPPRRRKRSPLQAKNLPDTAILPELNRWEKNNSELFRIVERESASATRARSAGGVGLVGWSRKPELPLTGPVRTCDPVRTSGLVGPAKARSVDNLLAIRCHGRARYDPREQRKSESDSDSEVQQVRSLRVHPAPNPRRSSRNMKHASGEVKRAAPQAARKCRERKDACSRIAKDSLIADLPKVDQHLLEHSGAAGEENGITAPVSSAAAILHFKLQRATDFSIENNSNEIEVRFRSNACNEGDGSEQPVRPEERLPLPTRVTQLRRGNSRSSAPIVGQPTAKPQVPAIRHTTENVAISATTSVGACDSVPKSTALPIEQQQQQHQFVPLAEVLKKSIDCSELKRRWINEFLGETDAPVELTEQRSEELPVAAGNRHREAAPLKNCQHSSEASVDIFRQPICDFEEFDVLFSKAQEMRQVEQGEMVPNDGDLPCPDGAARKSVKLSEQVTYIERSSTTSNLCFSSSSFSIASVDDNPIEVAPPSPPPPPPPTIAQLPVSRKGTTISAPSITLPEQDTIVTTCKGSSSGSSCKSTVIIQDYSSKHLQRVRYLSSPSPSRSSTVLSEEKDLLGNGYACRNVSLSNAEQFKLPGTTSTEDRSQAEQGTNRCSISPQTFTLKADPGDDDDNIVLPLKVIKKISPYDRNEALLPSSSMQSGACTSSKQQSTNEMNELHQNTFELTSGLTTTHENVNTVTVTETQLSAARAGSTATLCQPSTNINYPARVNSSVTTAMDSNSARRFIKPRIEQIPYNRNNINSNCTSTNIRHFTSKTTDNMAVSNHCNNNRTTQPGMASLPYSNFNVGSAFDQNRNGECGEGLEYQHDRHPTATQAQETVACCTTKRLPNDHTGIDPATLDHTRTVALATDLRVLNQQTSGGVVSSQSSIIPDYDEYYNEEGVIII